MLKVQVDGEKVQRGGTQYLEPPRYFESLLRGRGDTEAPDITARICGICPVAYQMSSCHAMDGPCGVSCRRRRSAPCGGALLRGVDREPRVARLPPARAGLPVLRRARSIRPRPSRLVRGRPAPQEGRQRPHGGRGGTGHRSRERASRRILPAPPREELRKPRADAGWTHSTMLGHGQLGGGARLPGLHPRLRVRLRCGRRRATHQRPARW